MEKAIFKQVIIIIGSQCIVFTVHTIACRAEKLAYVEAHDMMLWSGMYRSNTMHTKHLLCVEMHSSHFVAGAREC